MAKDDLKAAVLGATSNTPGATLGGYPDIAQYYAPEIAAANSNAQVNAQGYNDAAQVANAEAARTAALQAKAQAAADLADPSKYQRLPKEDGGYSFLDPAGKEISAYDYSRITGNSLETVLAGSLNPVDVGFQQDFSNLQDFMNAISGGDKKKVKKYTGATPELLNYEKDIPGLIEKFKRAYPTVFGLGGFQGRGTAGQRVGTAYVPYPTGSGGYDLGTPQL